MESTELLPGPNEAGPLKDRSQTNANDLRCMKAADVTIGGRRLRGFPGDGWKRRFFSRDECTPIRRVPYRDSKNFFHAAPGRPSMRARYGEAPRETRANTGGRLYGQIAPSTESGRQSNHLHHRRSAANHGGANIGAGPRACPFSWSPRSSGYPRNRGLRWLTRSSEATSVGCRRLRSPLPAPSIPPTCFVVLVSRPLRRPTHLELGFL